MGNFIKILALSEDNMSSVVFVNARKEAGINPVFNPTHDSFDYQVFIHSRFPFKELNSWTFKDFEGARRFAAKEFNDFNWQILSWDYKTKRPCELEGRECGSGQCDTCKKLADEEPEGHHPLASGCGSCGMA